MSVRFACKGHFGGLFLYFLATVVGGKTRYRSLTLVIAMSARRLVGISVSGLAGLPRSFYA